MAIIRTYNPTTKRYESNAKGPIKPKWQEAIDLLTQRVKVLESALRAKQY